MPWTLYHCTNVKIFVRALRLDDGADATQTVYLFGVCLIALSVFNLLRSVGRSFRFGEAGRRRPPKTLGLLAAISPRKFCVKFLEEKEGNTPSNWCNDHDPL
jgi:hypothetical protein